jgi:hypothetical protein
MPAEPYIFAIYQGFLNLTKCWAKLLFHVQCSLHQASNALTEPLNN